MFNSRQHQTQQILAQHTPETLLRDLLFNTGDHLERVFIIDRVRHKSPDMIHTLYHYLINDNKFTMPPGANNDKTRKEQVINELENAMLKQAIEEKTQIDLAISSPRPGGAN